MSRLFDLLEETDNCFYLATVDGDQPKLRPIGAHMEEDGKVIFGIGAQKEVCRQLHENPKCEMSGFVSKGKWFRLTGTAVFEDDEKYEQKYLDAHEGLKKIYNKESGHSLAMFHLENAQASVYVMGKIVEEIPL